MTGGSVELTGMMDLDQHLALLQGRNRNILKLDLLRSTLLVDLTSVKVKCNKAVSNYLKDVSEMKETTHEQRLHRLRDLIAGRRHGA